MSNHKRKSGHHQNKKRPTKARVTRSLLIEWRRARRSYRAARRDEFVSRQDAKEVAA